MYISNISLGGFGTGKGAQREFVGAADIEDTDGNPVAGAFVEGKFYGECHRKTTTGSALTVLIDGGLVARAGVYDPKLGGCGSGCVQWFEVTNVTKSGYTWDPDQGAGTLAGTLCR